MRLFLGIDIPEALEQRIDEYLMPLRKSPKGWEHPQDYHQTLLFIGEVPPEEVNQILKNLQKLSFPSFTLTTEQFLFFNRRIMYLSLKPSVELLKLKVEIDRLFPQWINRSDKPFLPHVTVKRWQRYEYDELVEGVRTRHFYGGSFLVKSVDLFKSEKDAHNQKYHIIERQNLRVG